MRSGFRPLFVAGALVAIGGSACAMKKAEPASVRCTLVDDSGVAAKSGVAGLCTQIEQTLAGTAAARGASVEVRALRADMLRATVTTAAGRKLPEFATSVSDSGFTPAMLRRFAEDLARHIERSSAGSD